MTASSTIQSELAVGMAEMLASDNIAQALLLSGLPATDEVEQTNQLAQILLCQSIVKPCNQCRNCLLVVSQACSDILQISPLDSASSSQITLQQVAAITKFASLSGVNRRIVIIRQAHLLNTESSNALLKLLEEPPPQVVFIISAPQPQLLLPTVASRCIIFEWPKLNSHALELQLNQATDLTPAERTFLLCMAKRFNLSDLESSFSELLAMRHKVISSIDDDKGRFLNNLQHCSVKSRDEAKLLYTWLLSWFRDLAWLELISPEELINHDVTADLEQWQKSFTRSKAIECAQLTLDKLDALKLYVDAALGVDSLWTSCVQS